MRQQKPVTLTKRQIDNALERLFAIDAPVIPRVRMGAAVYDYAWTIWAKRRDIRALQGDRAHQRAKRKTVLKP
jgi:hypothetical protein